MYAKDLDNDGDMDIMSASANDDKIAWYENNGAGDPSFTARTIATTADGAASVFAADLDGDGDQDVLSASLNDNTVAWYENGLAAFGDPTFASITVTTSTDGARDAIAVDLDQDGDVDIISASAEDDKVAWYENSGSESFTAYTISTSVDGVTYLAASDIDQDGDIDIVSASKYDDKISWFENNGSQSFTANTVATSADEPMSVAVADMDGDGDLDIVSGSSSDAVSYTHLTLPTKA